MSGTLTMDGLIKDEMSDEQIINKLLDLTYSQPNKFQSASGKLEELRLRVFIGGETFHNRDSKHSLSLVNRAIKEVVQSEERRNYHLDVRRSNNSKLVLPAMAVAAVLGITACVIYLFAL